MSDVPQSPPSEKGRSSLEPGETTSSNARTAADSGDSATTREHAVMFANRLRKRQRHLLKWSRKQDTDAFRIYDHDIPEIPLVVDWYAGHLHVSVQANQGALKHVDAPAGWLEAMMTVACETLGVSRAHAFVKERAPQKGRTQYEAKSEAYRLVVREAPARFEVDLAGYLDTGLFLDHRITRRLVGAEASGARVLNLFGYTGAFSVHAALGGAASTVTVDLSPTYVRWAGRNFQLNGLPTQELHVTALTRQVPTGHSLVAGDVFRFLEVAQQRGWLFDIIVVDPPTFSNSARTETVFDIQRDHVHLLQRAFGVTAPGGSVIFSTNRRRFRLDDQGIQAVCGEVSIEEFTTQTIPEDFRSRPHRCWRVRSAAA